MHLEISKHLWSHNTIMAISITVIFHSIPLLIILDLVLIVCMRLSVGMCTGGQVPAEVSVPLQLQAFVIQLTWVLGTKCGSSARAVHFHDHWGISLTPPLWLIPMWPPVQLTYSLTCQTQEIHYPHLAFLSLTQKFNYKCISRVKNYCTQFNIEDFIKKVAWIIVHIKFCFLFLF